MTKLKKKALLLAAVLLIIIGGVGSKTYLQKEPTADETNTGTIQSHRSYSLKFDSNTSHDSLKVPKLSFHIEDEKGEVLKRFDEIHGSKIHVVAVRKDRADIVYLESIYNEATGEFAIENAEFPSDGEYRLFTEFTPSDAQIGPEGTDKLTVTAYQDITVGDTEKYQPAEIGPERFKSSDKGFDLNVFLAPHDPTDPGLAAGSSSSFAVSVYKDGSPYTQMQEYKESRGSIVLIGPALEFMHTHATNDEVPDTFVLSFSVTFPVPGNYKGFLQTKTADTINNTDYVLTVAEEPTSNQGEAPPAGH